MCHRKGKETKKIKANNQWCGAATAGNTADHQMKTEFSNEWASTNKTEANPQKSK